MKVDIDKGHYTVTDEPDGKLKALRYGKEWRDLVGDNLILLMAMEVEQLRERCRNTDSSINYLNQAIQRWLRQQPTVEAEIERLKKEIATEQQEGQQ